MTVTTLFTPASVNKTILTFTSSHRVNVIIGNYSVIQVVLALYSPYFSSLMTSCTSGSPASSCHLILPDTSPHILDILLRYLYCGVLHISKKDIQEFLELTNHWKIDLPFSSTDIENRYTKQLKRKLFVLSFFIIL